MDNICHPGCKDCLEIANKCYEYGPVQLNYLTTQPTIPKHSQKLIITDYLLDDIANKCVRSSEILNTLNKMITSEISCDVLQLNISKIRRNSINLWVEDTLSMPREVLDVILSKWNVKSIILKFRNMKQLPEDTGSYRKTKSNNFLLFNFLFTFQENPIKTRSQTS
ncbi:hypothetical protein L5515_005071 [Caenorhabditis briggsae]|uniref:Uncharacterized protein n=1 Tax=Caenorhabditis briggsae TaxID=6238 RepID=A0AAE9EM69_CAEBR|nr:hypothetical protein L5515_005071 [Caenorhabditis briggsae]